MKSFSTLNTLGFFKNAPAKTTLQGVLQTSILLPDPNTATISLYFIQHQKALTAKKLLDEWANEIQGNTFAISTCTQTIPLSYFITLSKNQFDAIMGNSAFDNKVTQIRKLCPQF
jgi:hypothetical protein